MNGASATTTRAAEETERVARGMAGRLLRGDVILLEGDLAAGKTTFVRGLLRGLGGEPDDVTSPTFVLVQSHEVPGEEIRRLHHVDLYRLADRIAELRGIGLEELLSDPRAVVAVEWPKETITSWLPGDARIWRVRITVADDDQRHIQILCPA